jgi:hypothetical protein
MAKTHNKKDALAELLAAAPPQVLKELVGQLVARSPDIRRLCFDFLKSHIPLSDALEKRSEGEVVLALWNELEPDLSELDEYGGGDYGIMDHVGELLEQICTHLDKKNIPPDYRSNILDFVLPYIKSGNSGMDDNLYDVAYSACYDDDDLLGLAKSFEDMQGDWQIDHALRIYRKIGRRDEFLALRKRKMIVGADYHDLATFYWEAGEKEKALQVAETGLKKGQGRMDELRAFLADRAEETGDREKYLALHFAQTTDCLTFEKYQSFRKLCTAGEWQLYEPQILRQMQKSWHTEHLKIRMHREEYDEAIVLLVNGRYPTLDWEGTFEIQTAKALEQRYPEEVFKYYLSGLGNMNVNCQRQEYARKAKIMKKIRHVLVKVLGDGARWTTFAVKVKRDNIRRPAFQEEFGKMVPGWRELK